MIISGMMKIQLYKENRRDLETLNEEPGDKYGSCTAHIGSATFYSLLLFVQQIHCSITLCDPGKGFIHKLHSGNAREMINKNVSQLGFLYFFWLKSGQ